MKKITWFYDKRLRHLLKNDDEIKQMEMIRYAHQLVMYAVELCMLQSVLSVSFPIVSPSKIITPDDEIFAVLKEAYGLTGRIEVRLFAGVADACIGFNIKLINSGRPSGPLMNFFGGVDSQGARKLDLTIFDGLRSAEHFRAEQHRQFLVSSGP